LKGALPLVGQLRLERLDLRRQGLHHLRLRGDRPGLLRDQVLDRLDLALDGVRGERGRRVCGGRVGAGCRRGQRRGVGLLLLLLLLQLLRRSVQCS